MMGPTPRPCHRAADRRSEGPRRRTWALAAASILGLLALWTPPVLALDPWSDARDAAAIFVSDFFHVATAPTRINGSSALQLGVVAASTGLIYSSDQAIHDSFVRNRDQGPFRPWREAADFIEPAGHMGKTNPYFAGALLVGYVAGLDRIATISAQILQSHATAGVGKNIGNSLIRRRNPHNLLGPYAYGGEGSSFPSGHTSNIVQVATIIAHHSPWTSLDVAVWAGAVTIGLQRITARTHWPSDVWLSGIYGYAVSSALMRRYDERRAAASAPAPRTAPVGGLDRPAPPQAWAGRLRWTPVVGGGQVGAIVEVPF